MQPPSPDRGTTWAAPERRDGDAAATCVDLLCRVLIAADGDAAVLQAGQRPYLVSSAGHMKLAKARLDDHAVATLIDYLLPGTAQRMLYAAGLVEATCPAPTGCPGERFGIVAARFPDGISLEICRHRHRGDTVTSPADEASRPVDPQYDDSIPDELLPPVVVRDRQQDDDLALPPAEELWSAP